MRDVHVVDCHFHLDFRHDPTAYLRKAAGSGIGMLAASCDVAGYGVACAAVSRVPEALVLPALGAHPWWVADGRAGEAELARFEELAPDARAFGEVGLDFSEAHVAEGSRGTQVAAFERACVAADASSRMSGERKPISIHAVRSAGEVLDILEVTGCLESCSCVFHWFSGSLPELRRAIDAGCWFSANPRGLATGRGREYAKLVPAGRLLVETDMPPAADDGGFSADEHAELLASATRLLAQARRQDAIELSGRLLASSRKLLGLGGHASLHQGAKA